MASSCSGRKPSNPQKRRKTASTWSDARALASPVTFASTTEPSRLFIVLLPSSRAVLESLVTTPGPPENGLLENWHPPASPTAQKPAPSFDESTNGTGYVTFR